MALRKEQQAASSAALKSADADSQVLALLATVAAEAAEKEAQAVAEAYFTLDGYKRNTRHSAAHRMESDLALVSLKQARRERRVKRQVAANVESGAADAPKVSDVCVPDGRSKAKGVSLFHAIRKLRIQEEVEKGRREQEVEVQKKARLEHSENCVMELSY